MGSEVLRRACPQQQRLFQIVKEEINSSAICGKRQVTSAKRPRKPLLQIRTNPDRQSVSFTGVETLIVFRFGEEVSVS